MRAIAVIMATVVLGALAVGATCEQSGPVIRQPREPVAVNPGPTPEPWGIDPETADVPLLPPGFSSKTEYAEWAMDLLYYPDGTAKDQPDPPPAGASPEEVAAQLASSPLPPPGLITQPDGSTAVWLGEIPEGYVNFHGPGVEYVCQINETEDGCIEGTIIVEVQLT